MRASNWKVALASNITFVLFFSAFRLVKDSAFLRLRSLRNPSRREAMYVLLRELKFSTNSKLQSTVDTKIERLTEVCSYTFWSWVRSRRLFASKRLLTVWRNPWQKDENIDVKWIEMTEDYCTVNTITGNVWFRIVKNEYNESWYHVIYSKSFIVFLSFHVFSSKIL